MTPGGAEAESCGRARTAGMWREGARIGMHPEHPEVPGTHGWVWVWQGGGAGVTRGSDGDTQGGCQGHTGGSQGHTGGCKISTGEVHQVWLHPEIQLPGTHMGEGVHAPPCVYPRPPVCPRVHQICLFFVLFVSIPPLLLPTLTLPLPPPPRPCPAQLLPAALVPPLQQDRALLLALRWVGGWVGGWVALAKPAGSQQDRALLLVTSAGPWFRAWGLGAAGK